jgi:hypothetical protein
MPRTCVVSLSRSCSSVRAGDVLVFRFVCCLYAFETVFQRFSCRLLCCILVSSAVHCSRVFAVLYSRVVCCALFLCRLLCSVHVSSVVHRCHVAPAEPDERGPPPMMDVAFEVRLYIGNTWEHVTRCDSQATLPPQCRGASSTCRVVPVIGSYPLNLNEHCLAIREMPLVDDRGKVQPIVVLSTTLLSYRGEDVASSGRVRAVLCCAVLCCAVLCCAVLCCAVLCCAVLCCAVLCRAVPCCAVLCRARLRFVLSWPSESLTVSPC